jgi:hypothetical protein
MTKKLSTKYDLNQEEQQFDLMNQKIEAFGNKTQIWKNKKAEVIMQDLIPIYYKNEEDKDDFKQPEIFKLGLRKNLLN